MPTGTWWARSSSRCTRCSTRRWSSCAATPTRSPSGSHSWAPPPSAPPGRLVAERGCSDYELGRAGTQEHLAAIDQVYDGVIASHRKAITLAGELDPITEDILIGQSAELEKFQWFVRAHLERSQS